jgi:hypothetical protein
LLGYFVVNTFYLLGYFVVNTSTNCDQSTLGHLHPAGKKLACCGKATWATWASTAGKRREPRDESGIDCKSYDPNPTVKRTTDFWRTIRRPTASAALKGWVSYEGKIKQRLPCMVQI